MADVLFKQHLKLSPNAQFKNLVFEKLDKEPPKEEWRAGRVWFNTSIGKFQGIFYKLDPKTGLYRCEKEDATLVEPGAEVSPLVKGTKIRLWHYKNSKEYVCVLKGKASIQYDR